MWKINVNNEKVEAHCSGTAETVITESMCAIRSMYDLIKDYGSEYGDMFKELLARTQGTVLFSDKYKGEELDPDATEDDLPFC